MGNKLCRKCEIEKPWSAKEEDSAKSGFYISALGKPLSLCKPCSTERNYNITLRTRMSKEPEAFKVCEKCGHIHRKIMNCLKCRKLEKAKLKESSDGR